MGKARKRREEEKLLKAMRVLVSSYIRRGKEECNGCLTGHPSQTQHVCLEEDAFTVENLFLRGYAHTSANIVATLYAFEGECFPKFIDFNKWKMDNREKIREDIYKLLPRSSEGYVRMCNFTTAFLPYLNKE